MAHFIPVLNDWVFMRQKDKRTDTVAWGESIDLDPYVLYNKIAQRDTEKT